MPAPFYSIGLISVFASNKDQRIGDMVAGTVVVREREAEAPAFAQVFASPVSDRRCGVRSSRWNSRQCK